MTFSKPRPKGLSAYTRGNGGINVDRMLPAGQTQDVLCTYDDICHGKNCPLKLPNPPPNSALFGDTNLGIIMLK